MCCFSGFVQHVANTQIFARASEHNRQFLVYQMTFEANQPVAMILPIPVPPKSPEKAVRFINLETFPNFFERLASAYPINRGNPGSRSLSPTNSTRLDVVQVGNFVASFVPEVKDFSRLDPQFRLDPKVWDALPAYKDFGFAVFQLKAGKLRPHPMAFEFPRRDPRHLFFPTVHIHDGLVHSEAEFDHTLYCQRLGQEHIPDWAESPRSTAEVLQKEELARCQGILQADQHLYRLPMLGIFPNKDVLV